MKYAYYISVFLICFGCAKNDHTIENLNNGKIEVLGHAGSGISSLYPINSLESILNCLNTNADGTEFDVQLTKDNVLVAFHDEDLVNSTNFEGRIREYNWEELNECHYDVSPFSQYQLIRVVDLLNAVNEPSDYIFTFDIKLFPIASESISTYMDEYTEAIKNIFESYSLFNHSFVESQSEDFIVELQSKSLAINQFIYPQVFETGLNIAQNNNLYGITISTNNISEAQVREAHDLGLRVTIWDVHSKNENREAILKNPDMMQTDNIDFLVNYLN